MSKTILALEPNPTFPGDVEVAVPGQSEPASLELTFAYKNNDDYNDWLARVQQAGAEWAASKTEKAKKKALDGITTLMMEIVKGWSLPDEFNETNLTTLLRNYPLAGPAIIKEYGANLAEGRRKN